MTFRDRRHDCFHRYRPLSVLLLRKVLGQKALLASGEAVLHRCIASHPAGSFWSRRTAVIVCDWQTAAPGENSDSAASLHPRLAVSIPAFPRAPVRGISVAQRHSVFCFATRPAGSGSSQNKFAQTAKNAERISFGSLRKSRPSALGSRAHSRGFAMCAPSQFGRSKRRNRHVSEQNHAHRFPRQ